MLHKSCNKVQNTMSVDRQLMTTIIALIFLCHLGGIILAFLSLVWHLSGIPGKIQVSQK
jgi:hypothetical protein